MAAGPDLERAAAAPWGPISAGGERPQPWNVSSTSGSRTTLRPWRSLRRLVALANAYEAMDEAEQAVLAGDQARPAASARSTALRQTTSARWCWGAVGLVAEGRVEEARAATRRAAAAEPRSVEHLRRFAEAGGHLPGGQATLLCAFDDMKSVRPP